VKCANFVDSHSSDLVLVFLLPHSFGRQNSVTYFSEISASLHVGRLLPDIQLMNQVLVNTVPQKQDLQLHFFGDRKSCHCEPLCTACLVFRI
jgi:hypothetical protein